MTHALGAVAFPGVGALSIAAGLAFGAVLIFLALGFWDQNRP